MFLLDTDFLSELEKPNPDRGVLDWMEMADWLDLHLSVISVAELRSGIQRLPAGKRRRELEFMFELLPDRFADRILPVNWAVAKKYGDIQAAHGPLPVFDTLIAATAIVHRLIVITRSVKDIARTGAKLFVPWTD